MVADVESFRCSGWNRPVRPATAGFVLASVVLLAAWSGFFTEAARAEEKKETAAATPSLALPRHETRPVLPAGRFKGQAALSYKIASQIPEVIDQIYCYCRCKENLGHKSLLTCYVDEHSSHCEVCQTEALMVYDLTLKGKSPSEIQKIIDERYKNRGVAPRGSAHQKERK